MFIVIKEGNEQERLQSSDKEKLSVLISKQFKHAVKVHFQWMKISSKSYILTSSNVIFFLLGDCDN